MFNVVDLPALIEPFFGGGPRYPPEQRRDFRDDDNFLRHLQSAHPEVADMIDECVVELVDVEGTIANVSIGKDRRPHIRLNAHFTTWALTDGPGVHGPLACYEALACLLWHECFHFLLRHFRVPLFGVDRERMNVAQDIVIDNFIARRCPGWRTWSSTIDAINAALDSGGVSDRLFPRLTLDPPVPDPLSPRRRWVLDASDLELYQYLAHANVPPPDGPRLDEHAWEPFDNAGPPPPSPSLGPKGGPEKGGGPGQADGESSNDHAGAGDGGDDDSEGAGHGSGTTDGVDVDDDDGDDDDASDGDAVGDDEDAFFDKAIARARERQAQNAGRPLADDSSSPGWVLRRVGAARDFRLFAILRRYVRRLSPAQKRSTWKKVGRKLPGLRPGAIRQKKPGDVVVLVDVSGSMQPYLDQQFPKTLAEIYGALQRLARVYSNPSGMSVGSVSAEQTTIKEIASVEEIEGISLPTGGATHYESALDVLLAWDAPPTNDASIVIQRSPTARKRGRRPDLVLFVTDLDHDVNTYLAAPRFRALDDCLVWLVWKTMHTCDITPCVGETVLLRPDDWNTARR